MSIAKVAVQTTPIITTYPSQQFVVLNATGYVVAQRNASISSKATGRLEWLTTDGEKEMVLTSEPEASFFQRFYNRLIAPIVPEMLL